MSEPFGLMIQVEKYRWVRADEIRLLYDNGVSTWFEMKGDGDKVEVSSEYRQAALSHWRTYVAAVEATDPVMRTMHEQQQAAGVAQSGLFIDAQKLTRRTTDAK